MSLSQLRHARHIGLAAMPPHSLFRTFESHLIWEEVSLNDRLDMLGTENTILTGYPEALDAWIGRGNWDRIWSDCSPELCRKLLVSMSAELGFLGRYGFDESWNDIFSHVLKHLSNSEWNESPRRSTPCLTMLKGFLEGYMRARWSLMSLSEKCQSAITAFASYFAIHDMDLAVFGRYEQLAIAKDKTGRLNTWRDWIYDTENSKYWRIDIRIMSMQYGARLEDWTIQVSDPISDAVAEVFGEFWGTVESAGFIDADGEMFGGVGEVEHLTRRIPGMWTFDEDEEDDQEEEREESFGWLVISPERLLQMNTWNDKRKGIEGEPDSMGGGLKGEIDTRKRTLTGILTRILTRILTNDSTGTCISDGN